MNLAELNIYGFETISDLLAAGLFSGEPVCLVGEKGTAKTFLCSQVAKALDVSFIAYNASTINFEDVVGYPIPSKNDEGIWDKMDFIPTKTSIWGRQFVLVDELNRARIDRQNDLLQLIRNRAVQGMPVDSLIWVWAAVNPLSYEGTSAMDEAMADRFSWIIRIPSFVKITKDDRLKIIHNVTEDDMPGLKHWNLNAISKHKDNAMDFRVFFKRVGEAYIEVKKKYNQQIGEYVEQVLIQLSKNKKQRIFIDGRRAGMIKRNIMSLAAVIKARTGKLSIESAACKALFSSFPQELVGEPIKEIHLTAAHNIAKEYLSSKQARDLLKVMKISNPAKRIAAIFKYDLSPIDASNIISKYYNTLEEWQKRAFSLALGQKVFNKYENKLTSDILASLGKYISKILAMDLCDDAAGSYANIEEILKDRKKKPFYQYVTILASSWYPKGSASEHEVAKFMADHMVEFRNI